MFAVEIMYNMFQVEVNVDRRKIRSEYEWNVDRWKNRSGYECVCGMKRNRTAKNVLMTKNLGVVTGLL